MNATNIMSFTDIIENSEIFIVFEQTNFSAGEYYFQLKNVMRFELTYYNKNKMLNGNCTIFANHIIKN
jgi:hypothetical protein